MSLSSLFFSAGAKIIKGAFTAVKNVLSTASNSLFSKFIYGGIMIAASTLTSRSLFSSQKGTSVSPTYQNFKYTQTNPDLPLPIIYGTVQTAGNLIWQNSQERFSQKIIAFAEGEITDFTDIRINDIHISQIQGASVEKFFGTENQLISSLAPGSSQLEKAANVGSLKNVAYLALTVYNDEKISSNYNLTTVVVGKKIRVYSSETEYVIKYSENPAWVLLDFLTAYNGLGLALDDNANVDDNLISSIFDMQSFLESAAYCDEIVNGVKRFTFNMIFDSQTSVRALLDEIYRSCRGGLFFKNGQLQFKIDKAEHISKVFSADDISNEVFKAVPSEELYDILKVVYISPIHEWQKVEAFAEIPEYRNGAPVENSVSVYSCTNFEQASRLAWYYSNSKVLQPYFGSFETDYRAYDLEVGDVIKFDSLLMGLNGYRAKVTQITDDGAGTYTVNWQTYDERLYSDAKGSLEPRVLISKLNDLYQYPEDVQNFNVIQNEDIFNFIWQLNENPYDTYEIRVGNSWEEGKVIASKISTNSFSYKITNKGLFCFWIKAFNKYNYSENPASDIILVQDIPQKNVVVEWDLIEKDKLLTSYDSNDLRVFENCYIYNHVLKPKSQTVWINPLENDIEDERNNSVEIVAAADNEVEYFELKQAMNSLENLSQVVYVPSEYSTYGNVAFSEYGVAKFQAIHDFIITPDVFRHNGKNWCLYLPFRLNSLKANQFIYEQRNPFLGTTTQGFLLRTENSNLTLSLGDRENWFLSAQIIYNNLLVNTDYVLKLSYSQERGYNAELSINGADFQNIYSNPTKREIKSDVDYIVINAPKNAVTGFNGSVNLFDFKVCIDDDLIYQACEKISCIVTQDKKYIADVAYRDAVLKLFQKSGSVNIYTVDTVNNNFTRPTSKYFNYLWNNWEKNYNPAYETINNRWGSETSRQNIFISDIFDIGKELDAALSLELLSENLNTFSNGVEVFVKYSSDNENWSDFTLLNSGKATFRYAQFKIVLNCPNSQYINVQKAKIIVEVPDKTANYQIYTENAEQGFYLDYSDKKFAAIPSIVATVTDDISAYAVTVEKTTLGARIFAVKNNGEKTTGTIDLQIKGY